MVRLYGDAPAGQQLIDRETFGDEVRPEACGLQPSLALSAADPLKTLDVSNMMAIMFSRMMLTS